MRWKIPKPIMTCIEKYQYLINIDIFLLSFMIDHNLTEYPAYNRINKEYEYASYKFSLLFSYILKAFKISDKDQYWFLYYNDTIITDDEVKDHPELMNHTVRQFQDTIPLLFPEVCTNGHVAKTITLQVTDSCNLACTYCYQINKHNNMMSFETAKTAIDSILEPIPSTKEYLDYDKCPGMVLEFIGGEPFLNIKLMLEITEYFITRLIVLDHKWLNKFLLSTCSNGILYFDPEVQKFISTYQDILSFSISIDGNKELHDSCRVFPDGKPSYDIAIAGVKHYMDSYKRPMGSKMTIAPGNVEHVYDAIINLIELNYLQIHANCVYEEGWTNDHAKIYYYQLKKIADYIIDNHLIDVDISIFNFNNNRPMSETENKNWCGGNGDMLAFDYLGKAYPCIRYMESSLGNDIDPIVIGDINGLNCNDEYSDIINSLKSITRKSQSTEECYNCPIAQGCSWCTAYNYQEFGTANKRAIYICCMHKAEALANVYYWNKYARTNNIDKEIGLIVPDDMALEIIDNDELNMLKSLSMRSE